MELLYADDLVLAAETEYVLMEKLWKWKKGMESKGLSLNTGKTKVMRCQVSKGPENILVVFAERVLVAILLCVACHSWVHKRCSGISGRLMNNVDFHC